MERFRACLILAVALALPLSAQGREPLRCGNQLVEQGDTKEQVLNACGEPDYVDGFRWFYDMGANESPRIIVFTPAGMVSSIETVW